MRLQRNITEDQTCKYAIVRLDKLRALEANAGKTGKPGNDKFGRRNTDHGIARCHLGELLILGLLEYGKPGDNEECFVIKLKDQFAVPALDAYIRSVQNRATFLRSMGQGEEAESLEEYAKDLAKLQSRANVHPKKHYPD
jgi:hypothetical protein